MKRSIYARYEGSFYDSKGHQFFGKIYLYENGQKWVIKEKDGYSWMSKDLYFLVYNDIWISIPKNNKERSEVREVLDTHLQHVREDLEGNPLSGSYTWLFKHLEHIKDRVFVNSVDFIMGGSDEYRKI